MPITDKSPVDWLGAGYKSVPGKIELSTNSAPEALLSELSDADADGTTGDVRVLLVALIEGLYAKYLAKYSTLSEEDKSSIPRFQRVVTVDQATGAISRNYNFRVTYEPGLVIANGTAPLNYEDNPKK